MAETKGATTNTNYVLCPVSTDDYRIVQNDFGFAIVANRPMKKGETVFSESLEFCFQDVQEGDQLLLTNNYEEEDANQTPRCIPLNRAVLMETHGVGRLVPASSSDKVLKEHWNLESPGMLMNHSCDPTVLTTSFDIKEGGDIAARDIAKGEHLTCDYACFDYEKASQTFECACGASNCRGKRIGFAVLTKEEKEIFLSKGAGVSDAVKARHEHSLGKGPEVVCEDLSPLSRAPATVPRLVVPGPSSAEAELAIRSCEPSVQNNAASHGLFATKDIKAGRRVYWFWCQPWPTFPIAGKESLLEMVAALPLDDSDLPEGTSIQVDPHLCAPRNAHTGSFEFSGFDLLTHHSCDPNLVYKYAEEENEDNWRGAYACRDIQKGDQLFVDLNCCMWERKVVPCHCGSASCVGSIGGFASLASDVQDELKDMDWRRQPANSNSDKGQALSPYVRKQLEQRSK